MKPKILTRQKAQEQFNLSQYDPLGLVGFDAFVLFEEDLQIDENLEDRTLEKLFFSNAELVGKRILFIFKGNLTVRGDIKIGEMPCLLVLGDVYCDVLHSFDNVIQINGDAHIKYAFNGNYNHGSITILGITKVPFILNSDHDSRLNPSEETVVINYCTDYNDFFTYDYYSDDLPEICVKKALSEEGEFEYDKFIDIVKSGKSPIKKGAKPGRVLVEEMIVAIAKKNGDKIKKLDLTDKNLTNIPKAIFELDSLEELILENNPIEAISPEISNLKKLRVLNLKKCWINQLPYSFGRLQNLEELNLYMCGNLESLPSEIGDLQKLKKITLSGCKNCAIPEEITKLKNLEYLEYDTIYAFDVDPIEFPNWICELTGLKWLSFANNSFLNIPEDILNLTNLETLRVYSALCYVKELPDLYKMKNLKYLESSGRNVLNTRPLVGQDILQTFFKITSLEKLDISSYTLEEKYFPPNIIDATREKYKDEPEQLKLFESRLRKNSSGNYFYETRRRAKLEDFKGLDNLANLKFLDIRYNKLNQLPPEVLNLKKLEHIRLDGNNFSDEEIEKIKIMNPKILID